MRIIDKIRTIALFALLNISYSTLVWGQESQEMEKFSLMYNTLKSLTSVVKKDSLLVEMQKYAKGKEEIYSSLLEASKVIVIEAYAEKGDLEKSIYWLEQLSSPRDKNYARIGIIKSLILENRIAEAEKLLGEDYKNDAIDDQKSKGVLQAFQFLYGEINFKKQRYEIARQYLSGVLNSQYVDPNLKELYIIAAIKTGDKSIEPEIERVLGAVGERSVDFLETVKQFYTSKDGNSSQFDTLLKKTAEIKAKELSERIMKLAVDSPSPYFSIKDTQGKTVSLQTLKGKTVIIDFWATWCQPCVASFPGMQKAVDYYKEDKDVVFMFVHTAERFDPEKSTSMALNLIKDKGYKGFDVYMDLKDKNTGKHPLLDSFEISGLPTKLIINKKGIIKFKNVGFVSEEEAVDEIKLMVDLANK